MSPRVRVTTRSNPSSPQTHLSTLSIQTPNALQASNFPSSLHQQTHSPNIQPQTPDMSPMMDQPSSLLSSAVSIPSPPGAPIVSSEAPVAQENPVISTNITPATGGSPVSPSSSGSSVGKKRTHSEITRETPTKAVANKRKKPSPPAIGTRSSTRIRKAPERLEYMNTPVKKVTQARKGVRKITKISNVTFLLTNQRSRLNKVDIFHMLLEREAWTCLTVPHKLDILAFLPKNDINVQLAKDLKAGTATEDALPREVTLNFNLFRTDVAKFKEDLGNGHLSKTWQASAATAVMKRAEGAYDDWKDEQTEYWWGQ